METMINKTRSILNNGRVRRTKNLFMDGVKEALSDQTAIGTIGAMTLIQGLKYKGSVKAGIKGGVYSAIVLGTLGGVQNIMANKEHL